MTLDGMTCVKSAAHTASCEGMAQNDEVKGPVTFDVTFDGKNVLWKADTSQLAPVS